MNSTATSSPLARREDPREALLGTLPLLILVAFLFAAAYFIFLLNPALGTRDFPLWSLFVVLGAITSVGALVSWFYSEDRPDDGTAAERAASRPPPAAPANGREDFGRPVPEVVRPVAAPVVPGNEPWNEDTIPAVSPPAAPTTMVATASSSDVERALEEIAQIQRDLASRRPPTGSASTGGPNRR
jgi:hypothetical protein